RVPAFEHLHLARSLVLLGRDRQGYRQAPLCAGRLQCICTRNTACHHFQSRHDAAAGAELEKAPHAGLPDCHPGRAAFLVAGQKRHPRAVFVCTGTGVIAGGTALLQKIRQQQGTQTRAGSATQSTTLTRGSIMPLAIRYYLCATHVLERFSSAIPPLLLRLVLAWEYGEAGYQKLIGQN